MTALAPTLQAFFVTSLGRQLGASVHTIDSYRHAFRLLLAFARAQTGTDPSDLDMGDLDAELIAGFLDHLELDRHNSVATRNTRLAESACSPTSASSLLAASPTATHAARRPAAAATRSRPSHTGPTTSGRPRSTARRSPGG